MIINGVSAIALCLYNFFSILDQKHTDDNVVYYFYVILNWFSLLGLTFTLIHVADL